MSNMPHMSIHQCREVRAHAAQRRRIVRGVLAVLAVVVVCLLTLALWQYWPRTALGVTITPLPRATATPSHYSYAAMVIAPRPTALSNCTSEAMTC